MVLSQVRQSAVDVVDKSVGGLLVVIVPGVVLVKSIPANISVVGVGIRLELVEIVSNPRVIEVEENIKEIATLLDKLMILSGVFLLDPEPKSALRHLSRSRFKGLPLLLYRLLIVIRSPFRSLIPDC